MYINERNIPVAMKYTKHCRGKHGNHVETCIKINAAGVCLNKAMLRHIAVSVIINRVPESSLLLRNVDLISKMAEKNILLS